MDGPRPVTYGEFPELFEDHPPDEPVDLDDFWVHFRLMTYADREAYRVLYPPEWHAAREAEQAGRREASWELVRRLGREAHSEGAARDASEHSGASGGALPSAGRERLPDGGGTNGAG